MVQTMQTMDVSPRHNKYTTVVNPQKPEQVTAEITGEQAFIRSASRPGSSSAHNDAEKSSVNPSINVDNVEVVKEDGVEGGADLTELRVSQTSGSAKQLVQD